MALSVPSTQDINDSTGKNTRLLKKSFYLAATCAIALFGCLSNSRLFHIGGGYQLSDRFLENRNRVPPLIIFNRIPKCGSTTMLKLLELLEEKNQLINWHVNRTYWGISGDQLFDAWTNIVHQALVKNEETGQTIILDGHASWMNFSEIPSMINRLSQIFLQDIRQPIYINIVRQPVSRVISMYAYHNTPQSRYHKSYRNKIAQLMGSDEFSEQNHTLDRCLNVKECAKFARNKFSSIPMRQFLPMAAADTQSIPFPIDNNTLQKIFKILDEEYTIILLLEEIESGLQLLECMLPHPFEGIYDLYMTEDETVKHANSYSIPKAIPETDEPIQHLVNMTGEVAIYDHIVLKFCTLWHLGQSLCPSLSQKVPSSCQ